MLAEVEAFLRDDARQLLLVHGFAGSGKSRFAQSMEEYICGAFHGAIAASDSYSCRVGERRGAHRSMTRRQGAFHDEMRERKRLPVLVWSNLAVLANPVANLLEESLRAPPLRFNDLQVRELREKVRDGELRLLPIVVLDGYDEVASSNSW